MPSKKRRKSKVHKRIYGGPCRGCGHFNRNVHKWDLQKACPARCTRCGGMLDFRTYAPQNVPVPLKGRPRTRRILLGQPIASALETLEERKLGLFPGSENGISGLDQESRTTKLAAKS